MGKEYGNWPKKRKNLVGIKIDPDTKAFIRKQYPEASGDPERMRRIVELLYGKK